MKTERGNTIAPTGYVGVKTRFGQVQNDTMQEGLNLKISYCEYCGEKHCWTNNHHVKSKGSGGDDTEENLIELCGNCYIKAHHGIIKKEELIRIIKNRR